MNLTNALGTLQRYPCWSPDGAQIACIDADWLAARDAALDSIARAINASSAAWGRRVHVTAGINSVSGAGPGVCRL